MNQHRPTIAEINLNALRHNVEAIRAAIPHAMNLMAIVKANAYGHGAIPCSQTLTECGIRTLGVATLEEGIELRKGGIKSDILLLGGVLTQDPSAILEYHLKPVIHQLDDLKRFGEYLKKMNQTYSVHLKVDTGMGRLGLLLSETDELFSLVKKYPSLQVEGVMTHLARADEDDPGPTEEQLALFQKVKNLYQEKGILAPFYHIANSAMIMDGRHLDSYQWARPGIMLYGAHPHPRHQAKMKLKPVMTLKTKIMGLKKHPAKSSLSYGGTFVTERESSIGILPIGYADGYPRLISNRGFVLIRGHRAPIVGRICMDLTLIDVTDIPNAQIGDDVVLIGEQGVEKISAEEVATWAETISYEILCGITARVPRLYIE